MEPPAGNPMGNSRGLPLKDTANTDLTLHRGSVLATWYLCGAPYRLDPLTAETLGPETFGGSLTGDVMAHPKVDERTGELFWFDYGPTRPWLRYGVTGPEGKVEHLVEIDLPGPRLPHDMAITDNYAVLMDLPLIADPEAARHGRHRIIFDRDLPARFGVIPRRGQAHEIRWFEASPCYIYHGVNAWEEGDELVFDVCRVAGPQPRGEGAELNRMLSYLQLEARLWRYRFNLATGAVHEEQRDDVNTDFPSVDTRRTGQPTRYAYNVSMATTPALAFDGLIRYDLGTGASETYRFGPGRFGSEAPFAPRDGSTADDDGYLVTFVTDEADGRSEVQILDASSLAAGPIGRVLLPQRVPLGFHACWVRQDQLVN
jgi:carotenoid cleavage dioxygenase